MTQLDPHGGNQFNSLMADFGDPLLRTYAFGHDVIAADPINGDILRHDVMLLYADARLAAVEADIDLTADTEVAQWALRCMSRTLWEPFRLNKHIIKPLDTLVIHGEGTVLTFQDEEDEPTPLEIADSTALIGKFAGIECVQYVPFEPDAATETPRKCGAMLVLCETLVLGMDEAENEVKDMPMGAFVPAGADRLTIAQGYGA